jgi:hypothetical protein
MREDPWLLIAENDGPDGNGQVLGYMICESEEQAQSYASRRGEVCDWMGLYLGCPIADDFSIEVMTQSDFDECYRGKMPLRNFIE